MTRASKANVRDVTEYSASNKPRWIQLLDLDVCVTPLESEESRELWLYLGA